MTSKEAYRRYNQSAKGRTRSMHYEQSPKGIATRGVYSLSGRKAEMERENYHRIQDEAGCHWAVRSFYPGYRVIKALAEGNYEVVEWKPLPEKARKTKKGGEAHKE